jgi:hypothetical protein
MSWRWLEICQHHRTWLKRTNMCTYTNVEDSRNSTYSSLFGKIMITEKPWNFGLPSFETKAYWWTAASSLTLESPLQAQWNPRQYRISFYIISYYIIVYYIIISILYHTILHYIYAYMYISPSIGKLSTFLGPATHLSVGLSHRPSPSPAMVDFSEPRSNMGLTCFYSLCI